MGILCTLISIFIFVLFARAIMSWFPARPGSGVAQINRLLADLTEWAVRPVRRIIPPAGMFDLSFLVIFVALLIIRAALGC